MLPILGKVIPAGRARVSQPVLILRYAGALLCQIQMMVSKTHQSGALATRSIGVQSPASAREGSLSLVQPSSMACISRPEIHPYRCLVQ